MKATIIQAAIGGPDTARVFHFERESLDVDELVRGLYRIVDGRRERRFIYTELPLCSDTLFDEDAIVWIDGESVTFYERVPNATPLRFALGEFAYASKVVARYRATLSAPLADFVEIQEGGEA